MKKDILVTIRPTSEQEYEKWIAISTEQQAKDRVHAGTRTFEEEWQELQTMLPSLLPEGKNTTNHHFYSIDTDVTTNVGFLWLGVIPGIPENSIFLFDIYLDSSYRSLGIGRKALSLAQDKVKELQYQSICLNVLNSNYAKNLYTSMGYTVIQEQDNSCIMMKQL